MQVIKCQDNVQLNQSQQAGKNVLKGRDRTLVEALLRKKVLSSYSRLHLEKLQKRKKINEEEAVSFLGMDEEDEELKMLEKERRLLSKKIRKKKEIMKLQHDFIDVSEGKICLNIKWRNTTLHGNPPRKWTPPDTKSPQDPSH